MSVLFRRIDGTFVIEHPVNGLPYHVTQNDPLYSEFVEEAASAGLEPEPPVVPPLVPSSITRRQCAKQMMVMSLITPEEALAMTRDGTPPALVMQMIAQMPADEAIFAQIDFAADTYQRSNPLLVSMMSATGADKAAIDDFFRAAAVL